MTQPSTLTCGDFTAPRDILRAYVAACRPGGSAVRRGELADSIRLMMEDKDVGLVTFYDGPDYFAVVLAGPVLTLRPAAAASVLSLDALMPRCEIPDRYVDGAHACLGDDPEARLDPFPKLQRSNPEMRPVGDSSFMGRIQSGGKDVPDDLPSLEDCVESAFFHARRDHSRKPSARMVRDLREARDAMAENRRGDPTITDLAHGFLVPDDEDEGLDEAIDDLDDYEPVPVPAPGDDETTGEYPTTTVDADTVVSQMGGAA